MEFTEEMNLLSESGYELPFDERGRSVDIKLAYGPQPHPETGEDWFHHGIDFSTDNYKLFALATGIVSGVGIDGSDEKHGVFLKVRYGKYEVTYSGVTNVYVRFGDRVKAKDEIAESGSFVHMGVTFAGEEIDPILMISMLYNNRQMWSNEKDHAPAAAYDEVEDFPEFKTDYDENKGEIEQLMIRYFGSYMRDIGGGAYKVPQRTEESLRNIFAQGMQQNQFFQTMPSMLNPLGLGDQSLMLIVKAQNLLIGDFLNYMAVMQHVFLGGYEKKKMT